MSRDEYKSALQQFADNFMEMAILNLPMDRAITELNTFLDDHLIVGSPGSSLILKKSK